MNENTKQKIRILQSDIADLNNVQFLKKYPHLIQNKDEMKRQLQQTIKTLETRPDEPL